MRANAISLCVVIAVAASCGGRPVSFTQDGATPISDAERSDGALADITDSVLDSFCQGPTPKLIVDGNAVSTAYSPGHAKSTGGVLYISIQLRSSQDGAVAYTFDLWNKGATTLPLMLDLAAMPSSWHVSVSKTYCSVGGTDACQILGSLSTDAHDVFAGWVQVTGASVSSMDRATICLVGHPAQQPTHSPVMSIRLYASEKM